MFDGTARPTEESLLAEMADLSAEEAPRRFALCTVDVEEDDGAVLGWGLALADEAIAYMYGEAIAGAHDEVNDCAHDENVPTMNILRASSATRFPRMLRRAGNVRLIWVDAETAVP
jgi:hypothetical protein